MSTFNFAPTANQAPAVQLIPAGTPALTVLSVSEVKHSTNTGCLQAKLEFTVARGPYERRKIWMYIGDPNDKNCSDGWKPMCLANLQHMLESCGIFNPADPNTYTRYAAVPPEHAFTTILQDLDGKPIAVKLKIEKGKDGNDDRNVIGTILSPNPNGRTQKAYADVQAGADTQVPSPAATAANAAVTAFGATQGVATVATAAGTTAAQPAAAGFGQATHNATAPGTAAPAWLAGQ